MRKRHVYTATVRFCKYHGKDRPTDPIELSQHEIVLTTYGTVAADVSRRRDILHKIRWYRVVLDEGKRTEA
jgi:SNF2 family DNA or RNA helicase